MQRLVGMKMLPIAAMAIALMALAHAEEEWVPQPLEIPKFLVQEDWCLNRSAPKMEGIQLYAAVPGCKSFVVKQDTLVWNGNASCKITTIAKLGNHWWLKGHCSDEGEMSYVGDFRFYETRLSDERLLVVLTPPLTSRWRANSAGRPGRARRLALAESRARNAS